MHDELIATIAKLEQRQDYHEKRLDKQDELLLTIHELASDLKVIAANVEQQGKLFNEIITKYDERLKSQGERIGNTPTLSDFKCLEDRVKGIVEKPLETVKQIKGKLMGAVATGLAGLIIGWLLHVLRTGLM